MSSSTVSAKRNSFSSSGFTLIELLVVITIIGIMVGILLPAIVSSLSTAKQGVTKNTLTELEDSLMLYANDHHAYPPPSNDGDSTPLVKYLEKLNTTARGVPYFEFEDSKLKEESDGKHYYSQFGFSDEAFEFHYAAPQASRYSHLHNYDCSTPDCDGMNRNKPNLWTAGEQFEPGNSSRGIAQVNNFGGARGLSMGGGSGDGSSGGQGGPQGNEGVGNGEDPSASDAVDNDGDGTGPGDPGAQGGNTNTPNN